MEHDTLDELSHAEVSQKEVVEEDALGRNLEELVENGRLSE